MERGKTSGRADDNLERGPNGVHLDLEGWSVVQRGTLQAGPVQSLSQPLFMWFENCMSNIVKLAAVDQPAIIKVHKEALCDIPARVWSSAQRYKTNLQTV